MAERLDREAVDRVLDRAHRLESGPSDDMPGVEPDALVSAAEEVGIDPNAVRDSLAIERFSITDVPARRFDGLAGAGTIVIERELDLTVEQALVGIEAWLASLYRLMCDRRTDGSLFARRRADTSAHIGRMFSSARGEGRLAVTSLTVEAVAQTIGSTPTRPRTLVRISADRSAPRQMRLASGGALAGVGVAGGAAAAASAATVTAAAIAAPVIVVPFSVAGYAIARSGRGHADRLELELERLVSRVERNERPTGVLGRMAKRAKRAATRTS